MDSAKHPVARYNEPQGPLDLGSVQVPTQEPWNAFLTSTRFWAMTLTNVSLVLLDPNFATDKWYVSFGKFCALEGAGFWGTKTIDRLGEKMG